MVNASHIQYQGEKYTLLGVDELRAVDYSELRLTLDPAIVLAIAEAFDKLASSSRDLIQQFDRMHDSFVDACVRAMKDEEVYYDSRPVNSNCRLEYIEIHEMGRIAGIAQPALNRRFMRAIMHSERW